MNDFRVQHSNWSSRIGTTIVILAFAALAAAPWWAERANLRLLAVRANFDPAIGPARLIFGFEAVIIGGLGSMWGTLAGGIILGVAQAIGAQIDPGWNLLAGHIAFLVVLALRPQGLFPKVQG